MTGWQVYQTADALRNDVAMHPCHKSGPLFPTRGNRAELIPLEQELNTGWWDVHHTRVFLRVSSLSNIRSKNPLICLFQSVG